MAAPHPSLTVDLDRLERLLIGISLLGFLMAALGILGEVLGWWNDTGELLITIGTLVGVATAVIALVINATKGQVTRVADGVDANGRRLDQVNDRLGSVEGGLGSIDRKLGTMDHTLGAMDQKLGTMDGKLGTMDDKLGTMDQKLGTMDGKLDVIQAELDRQTGVMDRQLAVLGEIRDRL